MQQQASHSHTAATSGECAHQQQLHTVRRPATQHGKWQGTWVCEAVADVHISQRLLLYAKGQVALTLYGCCQRCGAQSQEAPCAWQECLGMCA